MAEKSLKKNTVFNSIKTLSSIIFPLITFPYISRVLLPENVGKINFGLSIVSYFTLIATLGITTYAIRECSAVRDDKEKLSNTASQIFSINIVTTIMSYLALAGALAFYEKLENYRLLIAVQSLTIMATTLGADWLNSAMEDFKFITIRTISFQVISLVLMFIFVHNPEDYMKYAVISLVSSAGANLVNYWYRRRYCDVHMIWDVRHEIQWKRHIMPIMYLFVMLLAQNIYTNVDTTMLGLMIGDKEVGIYSTANKAASVIFQVIISIAWVVMPRMSALFSEREYPQINELLRKVFGIYMLVGVPCLVGVYMLSKDIVSIVAGSEYMDSALILQILMVGFVFNLFGASFWGNIILLPSKREKIYMKICCVTAILNVISNYTFIPIFGPPSAAVTTGFCNFIMFIAFLITKDRNIKLMNVKNLVWTPVIGCILVVGVCIVVSGVCYLWLRVVLSVTCSVTVYFIVQLIGKNELLVDVLHKVSQKLRNLTKGGKI